MTSQALLLVTIGVLLVTVLIAGLAGHLIFRWLLPAFHKHSGASPKQGSFELGEQTISKGVEALTPNVGLTTIIGCLRRHQSGDWGDVDEENRHLNDLSLQTGASLGFESKYAVTDGTVLWILTFEDSSSTMLLTDEEYHHEEGPLYVRPLKECLVEQGLPKEG